MQACQLFISVEKWTRGLMILRFEADHKAPSHADKLDSRSFVSVILGFISGLQKPYLKIGSLGFSPKTGFVSFYLTSTRKDPPIVLVKWRNQSLHPHRRGEEVFNLSSVHQAIDSLCNAVAAWEDEGGFL